MNRRLRRAVSVRMPAVLDPFVRDLRVTTRMLAARPAWTVAAILCLAIATGANTAAFTLVNGLLLRPLPFDEPDRLVMVALREPAETSTRPFSLREYRELGGRSDAAAALLARTYFPLSLAAADGARMAQAELVSGNYFDTLRLQPFLGRFFDAGADRDGSAPLAVLSHRLWQQRFAADPAIVGRLLRVNGRPVVVTGIAPREFVGAMRLIAADLWLPAALLPDLAESADATAVPMFGVMGRLANGVTIEQAEARLTSLASALPAAAGDRPPAVVLSPATGFGVPVSVSGMVLALSRFVYGVMALLVAVACANVAALMLARGAGRSREIAVRLSLGASRLHIARQLFTETLVLALAGCAAGTLIAIWLTQALVARLTTPFQYVTYAIDVHPDMRVFACSAVVAVIAAALCGIAPLRHAARVDVVDALKQSPAGSRSGRPTRLLPAMVTAQFALSTALLVAAGTMVRTYGRAQAADPGFVTAGLIAATLDADQLRLDRARGIRLYEEVMQRFAALPGTLDLAVVRDLPTRPGPVVTVAAVGGGSTASQDEGVAAAVTVVSARYFDTLGLNVRQGRAFDAGEPYGSRAAVVNEAMAWRLWPDASPIGRTFVVRQSGREPLEVVGVVGSSQRGSGERRTQPAFYRPFPQEYSPRMTVVLRVAGDPRSAMAEMRRTIRDVHEDLSVVDLRTVDELLEATARQWRVPAGALAIVAALGLLLSAVGLYGVAAHGVRDRTREIGIRIALGARPADVRRLVLRQGSTILGLGLALGTAGTVVLVQLVRSTMFGVGPTDPAILAGVCGVLTAAGIAALYLPARRAAAVEPAQTLRGD